MAKLNGFSPACRCPDVPCELQEAARRYAEADATETTIQLLYKAYYAEMGGFGTPPDVRPRKAEPIADNVTAFRRPAAEPAASGHGKRPTTSGGADLRLPRRSLCRHPLLLALTRASSRKRVRLSAPQLLFLTRKITGR